MADFTDKLAMGTSRMNPSSMVPGAMGGNAPQGGLRSQGMTQGNPSVIKSAQNKGFIPRGLTPEPFVSPTARVGNQATGRDVNVRDAAIARLQAQLAPQGRTDMAKQQSDLPAETQQMLPTESKTKKNRTYKKEDFEMLSSVFKTLSEQ